MARNKHGQHMGQKVPVGMFERIGCGACKGLWERSQSISTFESVESSKAEPRWGSDSGPIAMSCEINKNKGNAIPALRPENRNCYPATRTKNQNKTKAIQVTVKQKGGNTMRIIYKIP